MNAGGYFHKREPDELRQTALREERTNTQTESWNLEGHRTVRFWGLNNWKCFLSKAKLGTWSLLSVNTSNVLFLSAVQPIRVYWIKSQRRFWCLISVPSALYWNSCPVYRQHNICTWLVNITLNSSGNAISSWPWQHITSSYSLLYTFLFIIRFFHVNVKSFCTYYISIYVYLNN